MCFIQIFSLSVVLLMQLFTAAWIYVKYDKECDI